MRAILLALLLAGCAALRPGAEDAVVVSGVVDAAIETSRAPAAARRSRLSAAQQAFAAHPDDSNRLRLATLLATLPAPLRDDARAADLLQPLSARRPETPLTRFAAMLHGQIVDRQRVAEAAARAVRTGERREEALRRRIEALRASERGLIEREERLGTRTR